MGSYWKYEVCLHGKSDEFLDFDLIDVVNAIDDPAKYFWGIGGFECETKLGVSEQILRSFDEISKAENDSILLEGADFLKLIKYIFQTINGQFFAYIDDAINEKYTPSFMIEFFDSTFCTIYSHDIGIIKQIAEKIYPYTIVPTDYLSENGYDDFQDINYVEHHHQMGIPAPHLHNYYKVENTDQKFKGKALPTNN